MAREIPLTHGLIAIVDDVDYESLSALHWRTFGGERPYAVTNVKLGGKRRLVGMHRLIAGAKPGELVDHINGNSLDNRRANLRVCSPHENMRNRLKHTAATSKFRGVSWDAYWGRWRATIRLGGKKVHILYSDDERTAARAYDNTARHHFGAFARLNFPESGEQCATPDVAA